MLEKARLEKSLTQKRDSGSATLRYAKNSVENRQDVR